MSGNSEQPPPYSGPSSQETQLNPHPTLPVAGRSMPTPGPNHLAFVQVMMNNDSKAVNIYRQTGSGLCIVYENEPQYNYAIGVVPISLDGNTTLVDLATQILSRLVRSPPQKAIEKKWKSLLVCVAGIQVKWNGVDNADGSSIWNNYSIAATGDGVRTLLQKMDERGWKDLLILKLAHK